MVLPAQSIVSGLFSRCPAKSILPTHRAALKLSGLGPFSAMNMSASTVETLRLELKSTITLLRQLLPRSQHVVCTGMTRHNSTITSIFENRSHSCGFEKRSFQSWCAGSCKPILLKMNIHRFLTSAIMKLQLQPLILASHSIKFDLWLFKMGWILAYDGIQMVLAIR